MRLFAATLLGVFWLVFPGTAGARHPGAKRTIFMNRFGGEYLRGWPSDSRINRSSVMNVDRAIVPAYPHDVTWGGIMDCMRDAFADFDIYVTDEDPGDVDHLEIVVGGLAEDLGLPPSVGGISPWSGCDVLENSIVFAFAGDSTDLDWLCWVSGQELGHSFGLDHVTYCDDFMTYDFTCSSRSFTDEDAYCGETSSRPCYCGGETQNSYQLLLERLGPHPPNAAPTVAIVSPADGAVVAPGFAVEVEASDDLGVDYVRLEIDGDQVDVDGVEPWGFVAPDDLAAGPHDVSVQALDYDGDSATDSITVTVAGGEPCPEPCTDAGTGDGGADARHSEYGCGCATSAPASPVWILAALPLLCRRSRRGNQIDD
jgi:hypothetical protein